MAAFAAATRCLWLWAIILSVAWPGPVRLVSGTCPSKCSGHGTCGPNDRCVCFEGWHRNDCSGKICPSGPVWWGKGETSNGAHTLKALCSNRGHCNDKTGTCKCSDGFIGAACEKTRCDNACNRRGVCESAHDMAKFLSLYKHGDADNDGRGTLYTNWESNMLYGCTCDPGYAGASCLRKLCPMADDPETTGQASQVISIAVGSSGGALSGAIKLSFQGYSTWFEADGSKESDASCATFMQNLESVEKVTCSKGSVDGTTKATTYTVTVDSWPLFPKLNNHFYHTGNPAAQSWVCNTQLAAAASGSPTCSVTVSTPGTKEYTPCAGRGTCDYERGQCECGAGYAGIACQHVASVVSYGCTDTNFLIKSECHAYTGKVLKVETSKAKATDFNSHPSASS